MRTFEVSASLRTFRGDIQGLRAVAVMAVLLYHAGVPFFGGGYVGVDVFFVISGFLITGHLFESLQQNGRIRFMDFYARRVRRILPASLVIATMTLVIGIALCPPLARGHIVRDALATFAYVPNVLFATEGTDYLAEQSPSPFQHYWSLGVEEQMYLIWPVVMLMGFVLVRSRFTYFITFVSIVLLASLVSSVVLTANNQPVAFFMVYTRAWEFLVGGIVAIVLARTSLRLGARSAVASAALGVACLLAAVFWFNEETAFPGAAALIPVAGTACLLVAGAGPRENVFTKLLSLKAFQFLGRISYSLYLVHWPLLILTQLAVGEQFPLDWPARTIVGVVAAIPLAWLLYRWVEVPMRQSRGQAPYRTLITAAVVTVLLAGSAFGLRGAVSTPKIEAGPTVTPSQEQPRLAPEGTAWLPENASPALSNVKSDLPDVYAMGCNQDLDTERVEACVFGDRESERRIVLFGDSHAAQWVPAFQQLAARDNAFELVTYTKSSCPSANVFVVSLRKPYEACERWRASIVRELKSDPPDVVVMSNYSGYSFVNENIDGSEWAIGIEDTVRTLRELGIDVVVIADTPTFGYSPPDCISANPLDALKCAGQRDETIDSEHQKNEAAAVIAGGGEYIDLNDYLCNSSTCPVVLENMILYRDVNHLTTVASAYLAPLISSRVPAVFP